MNSRRYNSYLGGKILSNLYQDGAFPPALTHCALALILLGLPVAALSLWACLSGYSTEYQGKPDFWKEKQEKEQKDEQE